MNDGRASKYHPVWTDAELVEKALVTGLPMRDLIKRCTGASSGSALLILGRALNNPTTRITVSPLYGEHPDDHRALFDRARDFASKLGLVGLTFTQNSCTYMAQDV